MIIFSNKKCSAWLIIIDLGVTWLGTVFASKKDKHEPYFVLFMLIIGSTNVPEEGWAATATGQAGEKPGLLHQPKIMEQNLLLKPQGPL